MGRGSKIKRVLTELATQLDTNKDEPRPFDLRMVFLTEEELTVFDEQLERTLRRAARAGRVVKPATIFQIILPPEEEVREWEAWSGYNRLSNYEREKPDYSKYRDVSPEEADEVLQIQEEEEREARRRKGVMLWR